MRKLDPSVRALARQLTGGDASRLHVVSPTCFLVLNAGSVSHASVIAGATRPKRARRTRKAA